MRTKVPENVIHGRYMVSDLQGINECISNSLDVLLKYTVFQTDGNKKELIQYHYTINYNAIRQWC